MGTCCSSKVGTQHGSAGKTNWPKESGQTDKQIDRPKEKADNWAIFVPNAATTAGPLLWLIWKKNTPEKGKEKQPSKKKKRITSNQYCSVAAEGRGHTKKKKERERSISSKLQQQHSVKSSYSIGLTYCIVLRCTDFGAGDCHLHRGCHIDFWREQTSWKKVRAPAQFDCLKSEKWQIELNWIYWRNCHEAVK